VKPLLIAAIAGLLAWWALPIALSSGGEAAPAPAQSAAPAPPQPAQAPPKTMKVFILAGQSNAGGAGNGDELPEDLRKTDLEVVLFAKGQKDILRPLAPYKRVKEEFGIKGTAFGPELTFAKEIKKACPADVICIIKQAIGRCSIIAWDKNWRRENWKADLKLADNEDKHPNYDALMSMIKEGVGQAREQFHTDKVELCGMLWVQSERDDTCREIAEKYEANLRALIKNVREDLKAPDLPFLFADANVARFEDIIKGGMQRIVKEVPNTRCIPVADLPCNGAVHYNTEGQIKLGRRFAEAWLQMTRK
jgi:hypothetical protein